jgi:hypothetical protein
MKNKQELLISKDRLMRLSMDLVTLLLSHDRLCDWLGPYEDEDQSEDYVAEYYREYYEERIGYKLLSLSVMLRTLDDRNSIDGDIKFEEPIQTELGRIKKKNTWKDIANFRTVLNNIIHAEQVIPIWQTKKYRDILDGEPCLLRERISQESIFVIVGKCPKAIEGWEMILDLKSFCDMVFRVVEGMR